MIVPKVLQLTDRESVAQWERIVPFVREIPQKPKKVIFQSAIDTSKDVAGFRSVTPKSMGFLMVVSDEEASRIEEGENAAISTIYKVSHNYPFVIRDFDITDLEDVKPETFTERIKISFKRLANLNIMIPSTEELKDLADFLENAQRTIVD